MEASLNKQMTDARFDFPQQCIRCLRYFWIQYRVISWRNFRLRRICCPLVQDNNKFPHTLCIDRTGFCLTLISICQTARRFICKYRNIRINSYMFFSVSATRQHVKYFKVFYLTGRKPYVYSRRAGSLSTLYLTHYYICRLRP